MAISEGYAHIMLCRVWYAVVTLCLSLQTSAATLQVSELEDLDMGDVPADMGPIRQSMQFCVAMEPRGRFNLIVRDLAGGPDFSLRSAYVETEIAAKNKAVLDVGVPLGLLGDN